MLSSLRNGQTEENLRLVMELDNRFYHLQGRLTREYGNGIHSKHRHMRYHEFFAKNLTSGGKVLDVGSGIGYMDYCLVRNIPGLIITGIELDRNNYAYALAHHSAPNLHFINGDVYHDLPDERFDVVTLSNVLEHFEDRIGLLTFLKEKVRPRHFLIRVPSFERDWRVPLKKELGIDYRLDNTHFVEYTVESFQEEMSTAGLEILYLETRWGEIWSVLVVK